MRVVADGAVRTGRAVDCRPLAVDGRALVRAIRGAASPATVRAPPPTPVHEYVGYVREGVSVSVRAALAAVARRRGATAPQDDELAAVEASLSELDPPEVDLAGPRERLAAAADAEVDRLREEVAARRGALQARDCADAEPRRGDDRLSEAIAELTEAETERAAARQAFERARREARRARDVRRRRLRLQDRAANLRRAAREHLAAGLRAEFVDAVAAAPGEGRVPGAPVTFEGDPVTAALAVARLADYRAPVVVTADRFETPAAAARLLDGPVMLA